VKDMTRRDRVLLVAAGAAALLGTGSLAATGAAAVPAGALRAAGSWGRAVGVPGLWALNRGGNAAVTSVSCPSAGNCTAGGYYQNRGQQGFVDREKNGRWQTAIEVPGLGALNKGGGAEVVEVSCATAGSCAAVGFYRGSFGFQHGFVVSEIYGRWRKAIGVPGMASLDKGGHVDVTSVSCGSATSCAAAGFYTDADSNQQGFVVSEINGRWQTAIEVPGLGTLNKGGNADVNSVSCGAAGNCAAGGFYKDSVGYGTSYLTQAFVVNESNGTWGTAQEVAANLNSGTFARAEVSSVSCPSAGNCAAGGGYSTGSADIPSPGFVISEVNGTWAAAQEVAGSLGDGSVSSVSCASAGNCLAGGDYDYDYFWAFVVSEVNGVWGQEISLPVPGDRETFLNAVSCGSPGNCAAGGDTDTEPGAFVDSQNNGAWANGIEVPGLGALNNRGDAAVLSVSCPPAGSCVAAGSYGDRHGYQGFVA
jgi:hypothetical protein